MRRTYQGSFSRSSPKIGKQYAYGVDGERRAQGDNRSLLVRARTALYFSA
jgi:hypothetical protein